MKLSFRGIPGRIKNKLFPIARAIPLSKHYDKYRHGTARIEGIAYPLVFKPRSADRYTLKEIFFDKHYDVELPARFGEPRFIIDGGANVGFTSVFFANKYPRAKIVAVEPASRNYTYLARNIAPYSNISGIQGAIWTKPTHIEVLDRGCSRGFTVYEVPEQSSTSLLATSLLDLMTGVELVDILKLDIEGSEKLVFEHDVDAWLPRVKCLMIELHDRMQKGCSKAVFAAMSRYDFSCEVKGENLVFMNESLGS